MKGEWTMKQNRILIADDQQAHRAIMARVFRRSGFEVILANNGMQALKLARHFKPQAVVLDAVMPGMVGYELAQAIRQDSELKDVLIIITSAVDRSDDINFASEFGADFFIQKDKLCKGDSLAELLYVNPDDPALLSA